MNMSFEKIKEMYENGFAAKRISISVKNN